MNTDNVTSEHLKKLIYPNEKSSGQFVFLMGNQAGNGVVLNWYFDISTYRILHIDKDDLSCKNLCDLKEENSQNHNKNLLLQVTLKDSSILNDIIQIPLNAGYYPENIHIVWAMTDITKMLENYPYPKRIKRMRPEVTIQTHSSAAKKMMPVLRSEIPSEIDGEIYIAIIRDVGHRVIPNLDGGITAYLGDDNKLIGIPDIETGKISLIQSYPFFRMKESGKKMDFIEKKDEFFEWIKENIRDQKYQSKLIEALNSEL